MLDGLDGGSLPGIVIGLLALIGVVYQARVGVKPAERTGFREDFQAVVTELRKNNEALKAQKAEQAEHIAVLEAKIDELTIETRALGGYTRILIREMRDGGMPIPVYHPPPDLTKHLIP
ncbi:hypothetical protein [Streptodolium elevatio]|uniref:Uncharacterized protein n=1 Tax=Streptodolium elevatio TaxID=3157996 RepID=A0ABV3DMW4_9ACTN